MSIDSHYPFKFPEKRTSQTRKGIIVCRPSAPAIIMLTRITPHAFSRDYKDTEHMQCYCTAPLNNAALYVGGRSRVRATCGKGHTAQARQNVTIKFYNLIQFEQAWRHTQTPNTGAMKRRTGQARQLRQRSLLWVQGYKRIQSEIATDDTDKTATQTLCMGTTRTAIPIIGTTWRQGISVSHGKGALQICNSFFNKKQSIMLTSSSPDLSREYFEVNDSQVKKFAGLHQIDGRSPWSVKFLQNCGHGRLTVVRSGSTDTGNTTWCRQTSVQRMPKLFKKKSLII